MPKWKNCVFNVSVDGTKEYYERIRGRGFYDLVKRHADRRDVKTNVAFVINSLNYYCLEDFLSEWCKTGIIGVIFDFYTPMSGKEDGLFLDWDTRDRIIDKLIGLKKKYGNFILNPKSVLDSMKSCNSVAITAQCVLPQAVISLNPMGKRKLPCVIGEQADCRRCGCVIPFLVDKFIIKKEFALLSPLRKILT